ncbi:MAG: ComF family protein [Alphaproteobacteria bacterium]|nr:ComF family protein [Alphaproteobacteria bacterium]
MVIDVHTLLKFLSVKLHNFTDFVFPPSCPLCGERTSVHGEFCAECWTMFDWIDGAKCSKCGYPFSSDWDADPNVLCPICASNKCELDLIRSACVYDNASRTAVLPFKHCGQIKYGYAMSRAMIWALRDADIKPDVIMPVPLAWRRLFKRGYNQASILARPIARAYGVPMDTSSVHRKYRPDMGHKNARERAKNIHGVFHVVAPDKIRGKKILLIDDVMTTGATFSELRRVLMLSGAAAVYGVTFCRVSRTI